MLLDPACPHTPPEFVVECERRALETGRVVVGVRPVTDTVKAIEGRGYVGRTVDRDGLVQVASPVVLPPDVATEVGAVTLPEDGDLTLVVLRLARRYEIEQVEAPPVGRRVRDDDDRALVDLLAQRGR